jgi:hypothetical protein
MGRPSGEKAFFSNILGCFKCCTDFKDNGGDQYLQPLTLMPTSNQTLDDSLEQSIATREQLWRSLGSLEPFSLSQDTVGSIQSGPRWPSEKHNFRVIHRTNGNVMIVSDGLSDPFDDVQNAQNNVNGFGLEFYVETPEEELGSTLTDIRRSWQFQLLYTVAQLAAGHGGIRSIIEDMGLLSTEAEGVAEAFTSPETRDTHVNQAGRVGALLGLTDQRASAGDRVPDYINGMPLTMVRLVNIKLISLAELRLITERGAEGRKKLSELFIGDARLVSSLRRPSAL